MNLYLDGVLVANTTLDCRFDTDFGSTAFGGTRYGHIGYSQHGNGYHFSGSIEMVDIYDAAITAQQVIQTANVCLARFSLNRTRVRVAGDGPLRVQQIRIQDDGRN